MNSTATKQPALPRDPEAERAVIAAMLIDPSRIPEVYRAITPDDIFTPQLATIFRAMLTIRGEGVTPDPVTVASRLRADGTLDEVGGTAALMELAGAVPSAQRVMEYAGILRAVADKRRLTLLLGNHLAAASNGTPAADVVTELLADLDDMRRAVATGEKPRYRWFDCAELAATDFRIDFLIDGYRVAKQPGVIGGPTKGGKTTLMVAEAFALATGLPFLGEFDVPEKKRVAVMTGESGMGVIKSQLRALCQSHDMELADIGSDLMVTAELPRLEDASDIDELRAFIADTGTEAVYCDPLYLMTGGADAANIFDQGAKYRLLGDLAAEHDLTIVVAHHIKKNRHNQFAPAELGELSHAGIAEWVRQWALVAHREAYDPEKGLHRLWLTIGGSAGHSSLKAVDIEQGRLGSLRGRYWAVSVATPSEVQAAEADEREQSKEAERSEQLEADKEAILKIVSRLPDHRGTKTDIYDRMNRNSAAAKRALAALLDEGGLVPCKVTKANKQKYSGYCLPPATQTPGQTHPDDDCRGDTITHPDTPLSI